jgi:hypothetical protein
MRRLLAAAVVTVLVLPAGGRADPQPPAPDPNFAATILPQGCTPTNSYETSQYDALEHWTAPSFERYPGACQRMRFAFGPIDVKPGQNDVLIQPITIEKPTQDGYIVRFAPNLVRFLSSDLQTFDIPPIEEVHLHHGTWITLVNGYFKDPFFASGEEKTIANFPRGYGFQIQRTDQWQLLHMVHNLTPRPMKVWITYDIDFVPQAVADTDAFKGAFGEMKPIYPVWLDVRPSFYPVFNVQRNFPVAGSTTCTWPKQNCAAFDPWGNQFTGQCRPDNAGCEHGNGKGTDWQLPALGATLNRVTDFRGGTLIGLGGHVHPGGLTVDVEAVRTSKSGTGDCAGSSDTAAQLIFTSQARYWKWTDPSVAGGPPTSWDVSMTVTGAPRWGIHLQPCDKLRINTTYDTTQQSTYENMGIAVGFIAPDLPDGTTTAPGVDPFASGLPLDTSDGCTSGGLQATTPTLCTKGVVTHGHMDEANNKGGGAGQPLPTKMGNHTDRIAIAGFAYSAAASGVASVTGIPRVSLNSSVTFMNLDSAADIYHTVTSCAPACSGSTGIAYPLADDGRVDFDSGELGYAPCFTFPPTRTDQGMCVGPAKNTSIWNLPITSAAGFASGETYTFFCRVHPSMRGVFAVE